MISQPSGVHQLGLSGIGEERRPAALAPTRISCSQPLQQLDDLLGEIGNALDRDAAGAALDARRRRCRTQPRAGRGRDAAGRASASRAQRRARAAAASAGLPLRRAARDSSTASLDDRRRRCHRQRPRPARSACVPGGIGRQDQRGDRRRARRAPPAPRAAASAADGLGAGRRCGPSRDTGRASPSMSEVSGAS